VKGVVTVCDEGVDVDSFNGEDIKTVKVGVFSFLVGGLVFCCVLFAGLFGELM
jgi:hypothetical protein